MDNIFGRLRNERNKLGKSQAKLAQELGVSAQTIQNWENSGGKLTPIPSDKLSSCAELGMDVQYILTGVYSLNASEHPPGPPPPINTNVLRQVITGVEESLKEQRIKLTSAKKAELICVLYEHFLPVGRVEKAPIERFLKLAA